VKAQAQPYCARKQLNPTCGPRRRFFSDPHGYQNEPNITKLYRFRNVRVDLLHQVRSYTVECDGVVSIGTISESPKHRCLCSNRTSGRRASAPRPQSLMKLLVKLHAAKLVQGTDLQRFGAGRLFPTEQSNKSPD
jgi:hypothetical protein